MSEHSGKRAMPRARSAWLLGALGVGVCAVAMHVSAGRAEEFHFAEGRAGNAELKYRQGIPVLSVEGTPREIGRQGAVLVGPAAKEILDYPQRLFGLRNGDRWQKLLAAGRTLLPHIPADYRRELEASAAEANVETELLVAANVMLDVHRGLGCSSLLVEPSRSATGGLLFGRNLDFFDLGFLHHYTLVTVCRPQGKHAFVKVGFPGVVGCLSGMNDAGLALAVHEVPFSADGSPLFNPEGVPYTFAFRRVLEECTTVDEAEKLLRGVKRTTLLNLAVCDRRQAIVLEMTPRNLVRRDSVEGICVCTNHFRNEPLVVFPFCRRYSALARSSELAKLDVADVAEKLNEVHLGWLTLQSMVFEPGPLVLHLAFGAVPSSAQPYHRLELAPLLGKGERD